MLPSVGGVWTGSSSSNAPSGLGFQSSLTHCSPYRYLRYVKPAYDHFVQPTSRYANIVRTPPAS